MTARLLDITPDEYHQLDHLSSSLAKTVIAQSPLHAKAAIGKKPTKLMDRGSIIHRLVLGKGADYVVVTAKDWKTKSAQEQRDAARAKNLVPVLHDDLEDFNTAAEKIRIGLADRGIMLDGVSEQAVEWDEPSPFGPVRCRAMFDHVWLDTGRILDLKVTEDASPGRIEKSAENMRYGVQSAAYTRAMTALRPELAGRVKFLFAFCEPDEPHAMNLTEPDGMFRELGEQRWLRAVRTWGECIKNDTWPAYGNAINHLTAPGWALAQEGFEL